jgi:hypothetical protein
MVALTKPITQQQQQQLQASGSFRGSQDLAAGGPLSPGGCNSGVTSPAAFTSPVRMDRGSTGLSAALSGGAAQQQQWIGASTASSRCATPQLGPSTQQQQQGLPRIKSGVIKAGDNMIYVEAQTGPALPQQQQQQLLSADGAAGSGAVGAWVGEEAAAAAAWSHLREGDPVGIITIEDVIEEVRGLTK